MLDRLDTGMKVAAGAAVALFVVMFFPWFGVSSDVFPDRDFGVNATAWRAFGVIDLILLLVVLAVAGLAFAEGSGRRLDLPVAAGVIVAVLGALATVLVAYRLINTPFDLDRKYGVFLGLLAAAGIAVGGRLAMSARGETLDEARSELAGRVADARDQAAERVGSGNRRYDDMSREELYEEAQRRDIEGRSEMNKEELAESLRSSR